MADIIRSEKPLAVSPIKTGQPLGAILASLGLAGHPLVHGARAAAPSPKFSLFSISMTRCRCSRRPWIRPPRSWGRRQYLHRARHPLPAPQPRAIVLLSTGLAEAQGSDIARWCASFARRIRAITAWRSSPSIPDFWLYGKRLQRGDRERDRAVGRADAASGAAAGGSTCWSATSVRRGYRMAGPLRGGLWPAAGDPAGPLAVNGWPPR